MPFSPLERAVMLRYPSISVSCYSLTGLEGCRRQAPSLTTAVTSSTTTFCPYADSGTNALRGDDGGRWRRVVRAAPGWQDCLSLARRPQGGEVEEEGQYGTSMRWRCRVLCSPRRRAFSSATFTEEGNNDNNKNSSFGSDKHAAEEAERLRQQHNSAAIRPGGTSTTFGGHGKASFTYRPGEEEKYAGHQQPTRSTYEAMSNEELATLLRTRESQVQQLRSIYERFHYEVDKHFRLTVLDYHDKAMQLSQVHGQMQNSSLRINREALSKMREEQEMLNRDLRIVVVICIAVVFSFWVWARRHYVHKEELEGAGYRPYGEEAATATATSLPTAGAAVVVAPSVTGAGSYGTGNWFGSEKRSARYRETAWEAEQRLKKEAEEGQKKA